MHSFFLKLKKSAKQYDRPASYAGVVQRRKRWSLQAKLGLDLRKQRRGGLTGAGICLNKSMSFLKIN